jgi:hypothetical protein
MLGLVYLGYRLLRAYRSCYGMCHAGTVRCRPWILNWWRPWYVQCFEARNDLKYVLEPVHLLVKIHCDQLRFPGFYMDTSTGMCLSPM